MAEEIGFENGRNSNFQGLVTLTLTLDPAIRHTVVHQSSTSTCISNFIEIEENFCGRTDGRTDVRTDIFPPLILLGRLLEVDLKINNRFPKKLSFTTLSLSNKFKHTYYRHISWIIAPSGWLYKIKRNMLLLQLVIKCTECKQTDKNESLFWPRTETKFSQSLQK